MDMLLPLIVGGVFFFIGIFLVIIYSCQINKQIAIDKKTKEENLELKNEKTILVNSIEKLVIEKSLIKEQIKEYQEEQKKYENTLKKASGLYLDILEKKYEDTEREYDKLIERLKSRYNEVHKELIEKYETQECEMTQSFFSKKQELENELKEINDAIQKLQATRAAANEARLREKEIEDNESFYSLEVTPLILSDIEYLDAIKPKLSQPRVLSMLIWQSYFQKPMTLLCNNILGPAAKTGIYKITNKVTKACYIGQASNISDRWKEHAKCGLGIDTPVGNKLYQAMLKYGIWNFTWEFLEECPREQLNEKEKKYIEIYQANIYGYNSTAGNKK